MGLATACQRNGFHPKNSLATTTPSARHSIRFRPNDALAAGIGRNAAPRALCDRIECQPRTRTRGDGGCPQRTGWGCAMALIRDRRTSGEFSTRGVRRPVVGGTAWWRLFWVAFAVLAATTVGAFAAAREGSQNRREVMAALDRRAALHAQRDALRARAFAVGTELIATLRGAERRAGNPNGSVCSEQSTLPSRDVGDARLLAWLADQQLTLERFESVPPEAATAAAGWRGGLTGDCGPRHRDDPSLANSFEARAEDAPVPSLCRTDRDCPHAGSLAGRPLSSTAYSGDSNSGAF